jgi:hypothetical protein
MIDKMKILGGTALFFGMLAFPLYYNASTGKGAYRPNIVTKAQGKCVLPASEMRATHMQLLNQWRDAVVRDDDRTFVSPDGRQFPRSLTGTCLGCHSNKSEFCDRCHEYAAVKPDCWDCHVTQETP